MRDPMPDSRRWRLFLLVGSIALAYALTTVAGTWVTRSLGAGVPLAPGIALALGLLVGPVAAAGVGVGHLLAALLGGTFALETSVGFLTQLVIVVTATGVWGRFGPLSSGERPGVPSWRNAVEFGLLAVTVATFATALGAGVSVALSVRPFSAAVGSFLPGSLGSMLTVGALSLYAGHWLVRVGVPSLDAVGPAVPADRLAARRTGFRLLGVGVAWCLGGTVLSLVFQSAELEYTHAFINKFGRGSVLLLEAAGPAGRNLQLAAGVVFVSAYLYWFTTPDAPNI